MESTATANCAEPCTYRNVRITRASLRVSGREDSVNEYEGADDLSTQSGTLGVTRSYGVSATSEPVIVVLHEGLHEPNTAYGSQALRYHVGQGTNQRNLPGQEKPKCYRRINVTTCDVLGKKMCKKSDREARWVGLKVISLLTGDTGGAVDEDKDHATEGPGDAEDADPGACWLPVVADDSSDCDVEEEEGCYELGD